MRKLIIIIDDIQLEANLLDTPTANEIYNILPIKGKINIWGDEIYFGIPISLGEEDATEEVDVGDLAFWPVGSAFCIFFGKTPVSTNNKPRAYSPVNIFGRIEGNPDVLRRIKSGSMILVKKY